MRIPTKVCKTCSSRKRIDEFYAHPLMADGRLNFCKECVKRRVKKRYDENPEKIAAYERERWDRPGRKRKARVILRRSRKLDPERFRRYSRESAARYPERVAARTAVGNAIRDKKLERGPCEDCGKSGKNSGGRSVVHAHHADYSKPLEVTWLCTRCHGLRHRDGNRWTTKER